MKRLGFVLQPPPLPPPPPGKDASPLQSYLSSASNLFVIIYPPTERRSVTRLASIFRIKNMMKKAPLPKISLLVQISVPGDVSTGLLWWLHTNPSKRILRRICKESAKHNVAYTCIPTPICTKGLIFSKRMFFILFLIVDVPTNPIISQTEFSWHHHHSSLLP